MNNYEIRIAFRNKQAETKKVENTDRVTAMTHVLNSLSMLDKDNVIALEVIRVEKSN